MEETKTKALDNIKNWDSESDSEKSEDQSWDNAENEFEIINEISSEEVKVAKNKMKRSIGSRFVGFFKKIVNKTKDKINKPERDQRKRTMSHIVNPFGTNIKLWYESDIGNGESDSVKASMHAHEHKVHKSKPLIEDEEMHQKIRMSTVVRPANLIETQINEHNQQMKEVLTHQLKQTNVEVDEVEDITEQISELERESDSADKYYSKSEFKKINNISHNKPHSESDNRNSMKVVKKQNVNEFAIELIDQMKFIIASEFNKCINDDALIHYGIKWSEWKQSPIKGVRYKCAICIEYNLWEYCEMNHNHEHLFIKIRRRDLKIPMLANLKNVAKANKDNIIYKETEESDSNSKVDPSIEDNQHASKKSSDDLLKDDIGQLNYQEYLARLKEEIMESKAKENAE